MGVDIEHELQTIRNQSGGDAVKAAIRSALSKIAQTRGDVDINKFTSGVMAEYRVGFYGNCVAGIDTVDYNTAQDDATDNGVSNSRTVTLTVTEDSLLMAAVIHRVSDDIITLSGDGWTRVVTTEHPAADPGENDENSFQYISAWTKPVEPGEYTVTATYQQDKSRQLNLKLIALHGVDSVTKVHDEQIMLFPYNTIVKTTKKRLYLVGSLYADNTNLLTKTSIVHLNGSFLELLSLHGRFCVFYDNTTDSGYYETFDYSDDVIKNKGSQACIVLDVD